MIISKRSEPYLYSNHRAKENSETKMGTSGVGGIGKATEGCVRQQAGTRVPTTSSHHDRRGQCLATTSSPEPQGPHPLTWAGNICFDWKGNIQIGQHLPIVSFHCFGCVILISTF